MWNYVQMEDGFWYMLDTTWDDQKTYISRKYFLSGGEEKGFTGNTIAVERQELYTNFSKSEYSVNFALLTRATVRATAVQIRTHTAGRNGSVRRVPV